MSKPHWYAPFQGQFTALNAEPDEAPFLCVTFNEQYAPFIRGAIFALLQRQMWIGSPTQLDLMRMRVQQLLYIFGQQTDCPLPVDFAEEYEDMPALCESLRVQDGKIQALCCGEWTDLDGQEGLEIGAPNHEGEAPQPSGNGGQQCYHVNLNANMTYVLPTYVSTGDTLEFSNGKGAAQGQVNGEWHCPNGNFYVAGACIPVNDQDGADPLPSDYHMAVIFQLAGSFYPATGTFVVPAGISNQSVTFQVNDSVLSDNSGGYSFDCCVTNNQVTGTYEHRFDFALGPKGWLVQGSNGGGWSGGSFEGIATMTANENRIYLNLAAGLSVTEIAVEVDVSTTISGGVEMNAYSLPDTAGTGTLLYLQGLPNGSTANQDAIVSASVTVPPNTQSILVQSSGEVPATYNHIFVVTFRGNGADPF